MQALLLCLMLSAGYVLPFYLLQTQQARNHPATAKLRMACTVGYCGIAWAPVLLYLGPQGFCAKLGLRLEGLLPAMLLPLLLTATIFLGPLTLSLPARDQRYCDPLWQDSTAWRDLVVAPVTEEFVFRALLLAVLLDKLTPERYPSSMWLLQTNHIQGVPSAFMALQGFSGNMAVLICPLFFGVAHLHHLHDYLHYRQIPWQQALPAVAFTFAYTTVFGWYAAWLFLQTGHLAAAVISHAFCNFMGAPNIAAISQHYSPSTTAVTFCTGIVCFIALLGPLTDVNLYVKHAASP